MAVAKLVKIDFQNSITLRIQDYTNFDVYVGSAQTVTITLPGEVSGQEPSSLGSYQLNNTLNPMLIKPESLGLSAGLDFPDGVYRVQITQLSSNTAVVLETDEHFLFLNSIDKCILQKTDKYLRSSCDNCKSDANLKLLQELVVIRQAAQLDLNLGQYAAATSKVTLLTNLCTGASCKCICGC